MHLLTRLFADDKGVAAIIVGLVSAVMVPVGITAYYFVQLSASKDILATVCHRVLGAYIKVDNSLDRAAAMSKATDGLIDENVIKDVTTSVTLISGVETFSKEDPEALSPVYELTLTGTDVAGQDSELGGEVGTKCKARLSFREEAMFEEVTRKVQVVAAQPPGNIPGIVSAGDTSNGTNDDIRAYLTQKIDVNGSERWLTAEVWRRDDGLKQWAFPTDVNGDGVFEDLRLSGTFAASNPALLERIRPTFFVNLTPKDSTRTWITPNDSNAPMGYPAIRPRCYDPDDADDDDGFGWEPDPALLPGGSGAGRLGTLTNDNAYDYIAIVGVDKEGKYEVSNDTTWNNLTNWLFQISFDGADSTKRVSGRKWWSLAANDPFISYSLWSNNGQDGGSNAVGYWYFKTLFNTWSNGRSASGGEVEGTLFKYRLTMKITCPVNRWQRTAVPAPS